MVNPSRPVSRKQATQGADLRTHQSRRGDSNPQTPVYKKYGSRPRTPCDVRPVLNWPVGQSDSPNAIPRDPDPLLANPLASPARPWAGCTPSRALPQGFNLLG